MAKAGWAPAFLLGRATLPEAIRSPAASGIEGEEDHEQEHQGQVVELGAKIPPDRQTVPRLPPGGQGQIDHVQRTEDTRQPHP